MYQNPSLCEVVQDSIGKVSDLAAGLCLTDGLWLFEIKAENQIVFSMHATAQAQK